MLRLSRGAPLLTAAEMRDAEARAIAAGTPALMLMERASAAAAKAILAVMPAPRALVLAGPGNNGGDGFGVAVALKAAGLEVTVATDTLPVVEPAATMAARWDGPVVPLARATSIIGRDGDVIIVDGLFGTGLTRPLPVPVAVLLSGLGVLRATGLRVAALDLPSGIHSDTGAVLGEALRADLTIAFGAAKPGHFQGRGGELRGRLVVADIGIELPSAMARRVTRPTRPMLAGNTHKYARGPVLVVEGEAAGAARLAARAALRCGAGLVTLAGNPALTGLALQDDALMVRGDRDGRALLNDSRLRAVVAGPGLADSRRGREWLEALLDAQVPLVLDAGALALLTPERIARARARVVLTPHEGEFVRLFGEIGPDRMAAVRAAAARANAVVLLKGPKSMVADAQGQVLVNDHAGPELATAGSGDVLAGIIAGLISGGMDGLSAAGAAAFVHGEAGRVAGVGLVADDLVRALPGVLAGL